MLNSKMVRNATEILTTLRGKSFYQTLTPREFVEADLDALAEAGISPEDDMRTIFLQQAEELLLVPVFQGDRAMFEEFLEIFVKNSAESLNRIVYEEFLDFLGIENINFFLYCIYMIFGVRTNPYLGLFSEDLSIKILRSISSNFIEETMTFSKRSEQNISISSRYFRQQRVQKDILYRGIFRGDGTTINRNNLKNAVLEYKWLFLSDLHGILADLSLRFNRHKNDVRQDYAEHFLKRYVTWRIDQYVGVSHASDDWFLENAYGPLENFLSLQTKSPKIERNEMRNRFVGILVDMAKDRNQDIPGCALWLMFLIHDIKQFRDFMEEYLPHTSLLHVFYVASIIGEFATDINRSNGVDITKVLQTGKFREASIF